MVTFTIECIRLALLSHEVSSENNDFLDNVFTKPSNDPKTTFETDLLLVFDTCIGFVELRLQAKSFLHYYVARLFKYRFRCFSEKLISCLWIYAYMYSLLKHLATTNTCKGTWCMVCLESKFSKCGKFSFGPLPKDIPFKCRGLWLKFHNF